MNFGLNWQKSTVFITDYDNFILENLQPDTRQYLVQDTTRRLYQFVVIEKDASKNFIKKLSLLSNVRVDDSVS